MVNVTQHKTEDHFNFIIVWKFSSEDKSWKQLKSSKLLQENTYKMKQREKKKKEVTEPKHCRKVPVSCAMEEGCALANELKLPGIDFSQ